MHFASFIVIRVALLMIGQIVQSGAGGDEDPPARGVHALSDDGGEGYAWVHGY